MMFFKRMPAVLVVLAINCIVSCTESAEAVHVVCPNPANCTSHLQAALDADGVDLIVIPAAGSPWQTGPLFVRKGQRTLLIEPGAELLAIEDGYHGVNDCLMTVEASAGNLTVIATGATLRMRKLDYLPPRCTPHASVPWSTVLLEPTLSERESECNRFNVLTGAWVRPTSSSSLLASLVEPTLSSGVYGHLSQPADVRQSYTTTVSISCGISSWDSSCCTKSLGHAASWLRSPHAHVARVCRVRLCFLPLVRRSPAVDTKAEWRMLLSIRGASGVSIVGGTWADAGGDGIYIADDSGEGSSASRDVLLKGVAVTGYVWGLGIILGLFLLPS